MIQMKDVSPGQGVLWDGLVATDSPGRKTPDWLEPGDILFTARGHNNYALVLDEIPFPTVLSPHFFHLTARHSGVLPAFIAWQINQEPAQQYLRKSAEGSDVPSIRRQVLEDLPMAVPPLGQQEAALRFDQAWRREQQVMADLVENRRQMMAGIARQLLRGN